MRILVPMDGSEQSWSAFDYAVEQFGDATFVCLRVIDPVKAGYGVGIGATAAANEWIQAEQDAAEEMFDSVRERAEEADVEVETHTEVGRPARTISEFAEDCDHVVIGSHGREGVSRILLGSVAETVVRRAPVPVTVVR
ncbi:MAG: nucleotide-binding universal stress UspA family protein [Natronomonas sp.]|jgi:nucleotide-binding universal stress UspA family protein|uniref:universal stress protein n=1 Tax=Natronomonas sp. TaxID=2184060 RepID=UPI00398A4A82